MVRTVGEEFAMVSLQNIQEPIDIVVAGGLFALSKDTRIGMDQELVQLMGHPVAGMWMKPGPIVRRLLQDRGWKDPEAFVKTDEEVMLEQMLSAMGEQGQAAGGQLPPGAQEGQGPGASSGEGGPGQESVSDVSAQGKKASMDGGAVKGGGPPAPNPA